MKLVREDLHKLITSNFDCIWEESNIVDKKLNVIDRLNVHKLTIVKNTTLDQIMELNL